MQKDCKKNKLHTLICRLADSTQNGGPAIET